jgi:periplasmic protein TonB
LEEHFSGIREAIEKKLSYPPMARRMGWEGTTEVSSVVREDGAVKDIKVLAGSGFELLDRNVVATVRACSPYLKPPVTAEVIMPITYRLD